MSYSRTIPSHITPTFEKDENNSAYIYVERTVPYSYTHTLQEWPMINLDLGENDEVIGIELVGFDIDDLDLNKALELAGFAK